MNFTNQELLFEIVLTKAFNTFSPRLVRMMWEIVNDSSQRFSCITEEMKSEAFTELLLNVLKFDQNKSSNPLAFCIQIVKKSFHRHLPQCKDDAFTLCEIS